MPYKNNDEIVMQKSSILWIKGTYLLRKMEFTSSWLMTGFFELAAMRSGRRKQVISVCSC